MSATESDTQQVPTWIRGMEFCHILDNTDRAHYCGADVGPDSPTCQDYDGEAICPTCGKPTCPRCAQLNELDNELDDA